MSVELVLLTFSFRECSSEEINEMTTEYKRTGN